MPARLSPRNRAKRGAKTAGAQSEDVPLFTRRRTGGEWVEVATLLHHQQAIAAQSRKARCKKQPERRALRPQARFGAQPPQAALGAEIGCSSVHPPPNRRRMGGGSNLALPPTGYCRAIAQSAVQKQPERKALRPQARFGAQPPQAANGWRRQPGSTAGGAANPAPPPTSYRHAAQSWHLT